MGFPDRRTILGLLLAAAAWPARAAGSKRQEVAYGKTHEQRLDVYTQQGLMGAPVFVFIHGGAWERGDKLRVNDLPAYAERNGFLFISIGYRLAPDVDALGSTQDVAAALAWVKANAATYGGDPAKIFVMGHSAGAHLAALVAVDPKYLEANQMAPQDLAGVILLDGAGYLAKQEMQWFDARGGPVAHMFHLAFDRDPDGLSPVVVAKPGHPYPPILIFYVNTRADSPPQAREMAQALRKAQAPFAIRIVRGESHAEINEEFGRKDDTEGNLSAAFIKTGMLPANDLPPVGEDRAGRGGANGELPRRGGRRF